ncbi:hypothetical protein GH733_004941 [Mirounga leonina]|nr:hypothetical protein GH733_004941 [Mirounga leonina]
MEVGDIAGGTHLGLHEEDSFHPGLWPSLACGLLLLVAFWNTVTWHLQSFGGTSGYFWQVQWERLLSRFEGKEWTLYITGVTQVPSLVFWSFNGLLLVVDTTGKPNFISRYRIQVGKNEPVDTEKLRQSIRTVLFNQVVISLPMLVFLYPILKLWGDPCHRELPTFHWFLLELVIFTLIEEVLFYYTHRKSTRNTEWTAPIGLVSFYSHPIDHVASNMLLLMVGPIVMGSHLSSITMWFSFALIITTISHSGYHLPFLPSTEFHDYHHLE